MTVKFKIKIGDGEAFRDYSTSLDIPDVDDPSKVDIGSVAAAIIQSIQQEEPETKSARRIQLTVVFL